MRSLLLLSMVLGAVAAQAQRQVAPELRDLIEQRIEAIAEQLGDDSGVDLTAISEQLTDRLSSPIDLNHTTPEELASLYLLEDPQIAAIFDHRQRFGPFLSLYELQTIDGLDLRTLELVRPFLTVRERPLDSRASLKEILKNGRHEWTTRTQINIEQRKGFLGAPGGDPFGVAYTDPDGDALPDIDDAQVLDSLRDNSKVYLGSPWKIYSRYRFRYRQNVSFGITAEKDEGEEFFRGTQKQGFDFHSAHLFVRGLGRVKAVALGDFQAQFGQGLVFWSGLAFSNKSAYTLNIKRNAQGLSPYASVNENLFLRGGGATIELTEHWDATVFASSKGLDANISAAPQPSDTNGVFTDAELAISSFQEDGFHRTPNELLKKDAVRENIQGGHLRYRRARWSIGATAAHVAYDRTLTRNLKPYNQFEFQGRENTTMGVDWNVASRNITWFGEGARSANGGLAALTGLLVALDKRLSLSLLYRDYQRDFQGTHSVAFAEGTNPWNERGLFTGLEIRPDRKWTINAYMDQFRFPWLRYQTDATSQGHDLLGQITWTPDKRTQLYFRARRQQRQRNTALGDNGIDALVDLEQTNFRFNASYRVSESVTLRSRMERVEFQRGDQPQENGFLLYQDLMYRPLMSEWELTGRVALFSSDTYNARIYAYENDIIGVFSIPPYYGRGMRYYAMVRYTPLRGLDLWVRYGAWLFNDQQAIGSGLQEISGDRRSDLKVQVRLQF
ncbi:MAG TPA: helix-hairpin-helix domain-containing protein [Flavobacteriales bacterium]